MNDQIVTDVRQLTTDWLTAALARGGALRTGSVRDIDFDAEESINGRIIKIRPRYDSSAAGLLPQRLLLKICADDGGLFGPSEVQYYIRDYAGLADAPVPRCYDAQYSAAPPAYHILMDDLSATHRDTWQLTPTFDHGCAVAEALAALHAHWWGAERLRIIGATIPGDRPLAMYIEHIRPGLAPLIDTLGDALDPTWRAALADIFTHHPSAMRERASDDAGFALVHGDVNPGNILAPRDGSGRIYLVDRQPFDWSLTTWLGVSDVAYMMVHWWEIELRRRWEFPILRHYHECLVRRGVINYSWEQLVRDYKLAAVQSIYVAVRWCAVEEDRTKMHWVWEPQLRKAMVAFFDLGCAELWSH